MARPTSLKPNGRGGGKGGSFSGKEATSATVVGSFTDVLLDASTDIYGITRAVVAHKVKEDPLVYNVSTSDGEYLPPSLSGLGFSSVRRSYEAGFATYQYEYEGILATATRKMIWELDISMMEVPITAHPDFDTLKAKYGWDNEMNRFPIKMKTEADGTDPLSGRKKASKISPMWGTEAFYVPTAVLRATVGMKELETQFTKKIGEIDDPSSFSMGGVDKNDSGLSATLSKLDVGDKNWLRMGPRAAQRGNVFQVSFEWLLSGQRGWSKDIYNRNNATSSEK